jgi:transitional endoplasmic reticulum ATPase
LCVSSINRSKIQQIALSSTTDFESRVQIFKLNMKERPVSDDVDYQKLSGMTDGYSSADIAQVCDEATDIPLMEVLEGSLPEK